MASFLLEKRCGRAHFPGQVSNRDQETQDVGTEMNRCRVHIIYSGRVQGVGFRYTVKSLTPGYEVTGTVRNMSDGRVELIAEGPKEELEAFRAAVRDSEAGRFIVDEQVIWGAATGEHRGFSIIG